MTLTSSGQISMSQINTELGRSSSSQISLDSAENGSYATINTNSGSYPSSGNPATMSEWYSYNHSAEGDALNWICGGRSTWNSDGTRTNTIQYLTAVSSSGGATDGGDLQGSMAYSSACAGDSYGFCLGGHEGYDSNRIQYWSTSSGSVSASDGGDIANSRRAGMATEGASYGYLATGSWPPKNYIDYITLSSASGNGTDCGDWFETVRDPVGMAPDRGGSYSFGAGGRPSSGYETNNIGYLNHTSTSISSSNVGDLTQQRYANTDTSGAGDTYQIFAFGYAAQYGTPYNILEYRSNTTSSSNCSDKGDGTRIKNAVGAGVGEGGGTVFFYGGHSSSGTFNEIEYCNTTNSSQNATDKGDLIGSRDGPCGTTSSTGM